MFKSYKNFHLFELHYYYLFLSPFHTEIYSDNMGF